MTAIEQNINIKPISITALLATFCLATPVKADTLLSTKPPNLILSENQTVAGANQSVNLQPATSNISLTNDNKPLFPLLTKDLTADKNPKIAQIPTSLPSSRPQIPPQNITPPPPTEPPTVPTPPGRETPSPLPPPGELLPPSTSPEVPPTQIQGPIRIKEFKFIGNTAFSSEELAELLLLIHMMNYNYCTMKMQMDMD